MTTEIDINSIPPQLRAIIKALGVQRALEFLKEHGGTTIRLPKNNTTALGLTSDELKALNLTLKNHLSGNQITLPKHDKITIKIRNLVIKEKRKESSLNDLAIEFDLCSRQIQNICKEDDPNYDLFEI